MGHCSLSKNETYDPTYEIDRNSTKNIEDSLFVISSTENTKIDLKNLKEKSMENKDN